MTISYPAAIESPDLYLPAGWDTGWRAAKAKAFSVPASIAFLGDSYTQGINCSDILSKSYPELVRAGFFARGYDRHGDYYPVTHSQAWLTNEGNTFTGTPPFAYNAAQGVPRWARWAYGQFGFFNSPLTVPAGPELTFTSPDACTAMDIIYFQDGTGQGTFTYAVDGGSPVTVTVNQNNIQSRISLTGLSNATHTIVFAGQSATASLCILGVACYSGHAGGLNVARIGYAGAATSDYTTQAGESPADKILLWQGSTDGGNTTGFGFPTQPALAVLAFGVNDCKNAVTIAAYQDVYRRFIQSFRRGCSDASVLLIANCNPDPNSNDSPVQFANAANYHTFLMAMYQMAQAYRCGFINFHTKWGQTPYSAGLTGNNTFPHPTDAGYRDMAETILEVL